MIEGVPLDLHLETRHGLSVTNLQVVLVHGAMDRGASMRRLMSNLSQWDTLAPDRRGYAHTLQRLPVTHAEDVAPERQVDDLERLCSSQPTVLFGHSMGGTYALMLAARQIPLLKAVVVYEAPLPAAPWWPRWSAHPAELDTELDPEACAQRAESFMISMIGRDRWDRLPPSTKHARRQEGFSMVAEMAALAHPLHEISYSDILVPVVSAVGELAAQRHLAAQQYVYDHVPNCRAVQIIGAPHGAHLSHSKAIAELIRDSIDRVTYT